MTRVELKGTLRIIFRGGATLDLRDAEAVIDRSGGSRRTPGVTIRTGAGDKLELLDAGEIVAIYQLPDETGLR